MDSSQVARNLGGDQEDFGGAAKGAEAVGAVGVEMGRLAGRQQVHGAVELEAQNAGKHMDPLLAPVADEGRRGAVRLDGQLDRLDGTGPREPAVEGDGKAVDFVGGLVAVEDRQGGGDRGLSEEDAHRHPQDAAQAEERGDRRLTLTGFQAGQVGLGEAGPLGQLVEGVPASGPGGADGLGD
jgi:hypothetical protein